MAICKGKTSHSLHSRSPFAKLFRSCLPAGEKECKDLRAGTEISRRPPGNRWADALIIAKFLGWKVERVEEAVAEIGEIEQAKPGREREIKKEIIERMPSSRARHHKQARAALVKGARDYLHYLCCLDGWKCPLRSDPHFQEIARRIGLDPQNAIPMPRHGRRMTRNAPLPRELFRTMLREKAHSATNVAGLSKEV